MIPDLDIFRTANVLVKQYGEDAPIEAAMWADSLLDKGDMNGVSVFMRAVEELISKKRPKGATVQ